MPFDYSEIMLAQNERITNELAQMAAELEAGRLSDDADRTTMAANRILELDAQRNALAVRANQYARQRQAPQGNQFGLSPDEVEIARGIGGDNRSLTNEQREQIYAQNKQKYQHMRATGEYRDDQGRVTR